MQGTSVTVAFLLASALTFAQTAGPASQVSPAQVSAAIDKLGTLEFPVRMEAARTARRAAAAVAVPALTDAAIGHKDGYVRFRALVLLSGFNDPRTREVMARVLADPNDRLRAVAYAYFEHHPDPEVLPRLGDRFLRAAGNEEAGSGLGVSIARRIAHAHGMRIAFAMRDAQSDFGPGLRVTIRRGA